MGFLDVAFLPSSASFITTSHRHSGRCEGIGTTTCLKTVVGAKQWHAV